MTQFNFASDALKPQRSLTRGREMSMHETKDCLPAGHGNEANRAPRAISKPRGSSTEKPEQGMAELHFLMGTQRKNCWGHQPGNLGWGFANRSPLFIQLPA